MYLPENEALTIDIADKGAKLSRVWDREAGYERLWGADPATWNRHAPILFPFVGKVIGGKYRLTGREYEMKTQHGFARDMDFICTEATGDTVCQVLCSTEATRRRYPFDFRLQVCHQLDGANPRLLHVEWEITNTGGETMYYSIGGHPGFLPPAGVKNEDYFIGFPGKPRLRYISADHAGFAVPETVHELTLPDSAAPYDESLPETWIFEDSQLSHVQLLRPGKSPWVTLNCAGFPILAVRANAAGPFVCLEPWYGRTDDAGFAGEFSEKVCEEHLVPGATKSIAYSMEFHR